MEIKIGIQNAARELSLESTQTLAEVTDAVSKALTDGGLLSLTDEKGRTVLVPTTSIAYIELGAEEHRRIGFGVG